MARSTAARFRLAGLLVAAAVFAGATRARAQVMITSSRVSAPASTPAPPPPPPPPTDVTVVHLSNGGYAAGAPQAAADRETLRWQADGFARPLDFALEEVDSVTWPPPARLPAPAGDYSFELAGGDVVFGGLVGLDDATAELDVPRLGRLHVERANVHRIVRRGERTDAIYSGPNGLAGWQQPPLKEGWREESGQPVTDRAGATIRGDVGLPARAVVEFTLSWKDRPDFVLALGVGDDEASLRQAFRFEVWDGDLVVVRELPTAADVAALRPPASLPADPFVPADRPAADVPAIRPPGPGPGPGAGPGPGPGRVQFLAYLDQEAGRILVVAPDGRFLADLTVPGDTRRVLPGVALANVRGDVRLERLRIGRWDGTPPREAQADRSRVHRVDGTITYGQVAGYDPAAREFLLRGEAGESRVPAGEVTDVFLSTPGEAPPRAVLATYADGTRLGGELRSIGAGSLELATPGIREALKLPFEGIRSVVAQKHEVGTPPAAGRSGTLELAGVRLHGRLVDARAAADSTALAWQPDGAAAASPLRPGAAGRIVYKESKPPAPPQPPQAMGRPVARPGLAGAVDAFVNGLTGVGGPQPRPAARRALHLRTGDVIPCEVTAIDEEGVRFKAPLSQATFVPHAKVKAVELAGLEPGAIKLTKSKRERLLTLPRMQKDSPPTQLIRSRNGDYLRGRIVAMDDAALRVEVRLETRALPRDRVARIIWFHADELGPAKRPDPAGPDGALRVQAVRGDGVRLTFRAEELTGGLLAGTSDVLGACKVPLEEADQLLIGPAIEAAAAQLTYGRWALRNAEEPKYLRAGGGGGTPGMESPLVGKPAPAFELDLLDGKPFRLADNKGQVVVLDFWATWCGPCLQAMPQVERVTKEFRERGVRLVAVNLQEAPNDIRAMLERNKFDVPVALDVDGVVAERYNATAIPQTVVIDREGKVARLFVGGGPDLGDQLREALTKLPGLGPAAQAN